MDPVVHFEIPATDRKRVADFYSKVFGWQNELLGEDMDNYVIATTTELDNNRMPKTPGSINGGFYLKKQGESEHPSVVISVEDIKESMKEIEKEGGKIIGKPVEIHGIGLYVSFIDSEQNQLSIMQPFPREK